MPTLNPRLTITLPPGIAAQLRAISELTGNSQSSLIADLLEGSGEVFARVIEVLTAAKDAKESMRGKIKADLEIAQERVEAQLGFVMNEFTQATGSLIDEAEAIKRRARKKAGGSPRRVVTPLSNRGVRSTKKQGTTRGKNHGPV